MRIGRLPGRRLSRRRRSLCLFLRARSGAARAAGHAQLHRDQQVAARRLRRAAAPTVQRVCRAGGDPRLRPFAHLRGRRHLPLHHRRPARIRAIGHGGGRRRRVGRRAAGRGGSGRAAYGERLPGPPRPLHRAVVGALCPRTRLSGALEPIRRRPLEPGIARGRDADGTAARARRAAGRACRVQADVWQSRPG